MSLERLFLAVLIASLFGFGGLGSLPVLRSQLASAGVPGSDTLILHSLAVGNISPGPNGLYLVAIGYFVGGVRGALLSCLALTLPPLLVLVLARLRDRLIHLRRFRTTLQSLALAVVALLATASSSLVVHAAATPVATVMVAMGAVLLLVRVPPLVTVLGAIGTGLVLR